MRTAYYNIINSLTFLAFVVMFAACSKSDQRRELEQLRGKTGVTRVNEAPVHTVYDLNPDSCFAAELMINNNEEINMLEAAYVRSATKTLKYTAEKLLADHNVLKRKLEKYFAKKHYPITPTTDKYQKILDKISSKPGAEWDRAWSEEMLRLHEEAMVKCEDCTKQVENKQLRDIVNKSLPSLRSHLGLINNLWQDKPKTNRTTSIAAL